MFSASSPGSSFVCLMYYNTPREDSLSRRQSVMIQACYRAKLMSGRYRDHGRTPVLAAITHGSGSFRITVIAPIMDSDIVM